MDTLVPIEKERLKELYDLEILDTGREARFDRFTNLISEIFEVPIVLISLIDINRQWFKSCVGLEVPETPRSISFCAHALKEENILIIHDATQDVRFSDNPLVLNEPYIRFYAGAVLRGPTGKALGTLCIMDSTPREFHKKQQQNLIKFARLVEHELSYNFYLNQMREKIEKALYYDITTKLPNRRLLKERLKNAISITEPLEQIAVIALNVNRFQDIKAMQGLEISQQIIKKISKRLNAIFSTRDIVSRWEENYFIIFLSINSSISPLLANIKRIINIFEKPIKIKDESYFITAGLGISLFPQDSNDAEHLIEKAIFAMRSHADLNKSHYEFYSETSTQIISKQLEIERLLKKAINEQELHVFYQPKIDVLTGKVCGAEALCRWHTTRDEISPSTFVSIAEQSDMIIEIGKFMLNEVCKQIVKWKAQNILDIPIAVNISQKQLLHASFHSDLKELLKFYNLEPNAIHLEITESTLINFSESLKVMQDLNDMGINFALDDFGTGYSSLSYLQRIPLKYLKIDKSFITKMVEIPQKAALVHAIIAMAKALNMTSIAEGVETNDQVLYLKAYQCDQIQGFIYSKPLSAPDFIEFLQNN